MKKWFVASAIMVLMVLLSTPTTLAASRAQGNTRAAAATHVVSPLVQVHPNTSVISCSGYGCDDVYAYPQPSNVDGSNCGGSWLGWLPGEPEWSKMYYSSSCGTNFAYVTSSPDGSPLIEVHIERRTVPGDERRGFIDSINNNYTFCLPPGSPGNSDWESFCDPDIIPNGAHTWITNMLYAPQDQVRVCVSTVNHPAANPWNYCSLWH
jgi:hypothetical protein